MLKNTETQDGARSRVNINLPAGEAVKGKGPKGEGHDRDNGDVNLPHHSDATSYLPDTQQSSRKGNTTCHGRLEGVALSQSRTRGAKHPLCAGSIIAMPSFHPEQAKAKRVQSRWRSPRQQQQQQARPARCGWHHQYLARTIGIHPSAGRGTGPLARCDAARQRHRQRHSTGGRQGQVGRHSAVFPGFQSRTVAEVAGRGSEGRREASESGEAARLGCDGQQPVKKLSFPCGQEEKGAMTSATAFTQISGQQPSYWPCHSASAVAGSCAVLHLPPCFHVHVLSPSVQPSQIGRVL